jgi:hypothetical protein
MCNLIINLPSLFFSSTARAQVVSSAPDNPTPQLGDTICVSVNIAGVTDLYAVSFDLSYDPAILNYVGTTEGTFLNQDAQGTSMQAALLNGAPGQLVVGISRIGNISGVPSVRLMIAGPTLIALT